MVKQEMINVILAESRHVSASSVKMSDVVNYDKS